MRRTPSAFVLSAGLVLIAGSGGALAQDSTDVPRTAAELAREDACSRQHYELRQKHGDDARARRDGLRALRKQCAGTGSYEYLLALAERQSGDEAAAVALYEDAVKKKLPYYEHSFVSLNTVRAEQAYTAQPRDLERFRALHAELERFATDHPRFGFTFQQLASQSLALGDWNDAAAHARKAIDLEPDAPRPRRHLVVALHAAERCPEAVREIRPAIERDPDLISEDAFMFAAVDCYAETGELATGKAALDALLKKNPALKDDPRATQLQRFFAAKLAPAQP